MGIKRKAAFLFLIITLIGGIFVSCKKSSPSWDTNVLAPIINASMSINNLLPDSLIQRNPDSSVTLVYNGSISTINTGNIVSIPDTTLVSTYNPFFSTTIYPGKAFISPISKTTVYDLGAAQLKQGTLETGYVKVFVTSLINRVTDYTCTFSNTTLNGKPLVLYLKVPASTGSVASYAQETYSLANYQVDFRGPTGNSYNIIESTFQGILDSTATSTIVSPGDSVTIGATFYSMTPSYVSGYFGTTTKTFTQQEAFPLFNTLSGTLKMQDISVNMVIENQFGVDARLDISQLSSVNSATTTSVNLNDPAFINTSININRATQTNNPASPVDPSIKSFALTSANSNIVNWANNLPNNIYYALQVTTDPLGNVSGSNDFAYLGYGIQTNLNVSIPLSLIANNLTLKDTLGINIPVGNATQQVKSGSFTFYVTNGFPFSGGLQIYLLNNKMGIADSLFVTPQTITAGIMNSNGTVVTPQNSVLNFTLNPARTQLLLNTKNIIILSRFNMGCLTCLPKVYRKIYSYYLLKVKLVGNFDYEVN